MHDEDRTLEVTLPIPYLILSWDRWISPTFTLLPVNNGPTQPIQVLDEPLET